MSNENQDPDKEFTLEEKRQLVSQGLMAPEEIGLAPEGNNLEILPDAEPVVKLGPVLNFKAGVVPIELRMHWARAECKIVGSFDEEKWMAEHRHEYAIQGQLNCGNVQARIGKTFKDPVIGFCELLRQAAEQLEQHYIKGSNASAKKDKPDSSEA